MKEFDKNYKLLDEMYQDGHHVEQGVLNVTAEDVAGHELRGRHILQGRVGEDLAGHLGLRPS